MLQITGRDLVQWDTPRNPQKATALHGDIMEYKAKINHAKKRKVREHRVEVRLSDDELNQLKNANASSIARLLRESALSAVNKQETQVPQFTKLDRDFLLELSRIGNNINQIAKAINTELQQIDRLMPHVFAPFDRS